MKINISRTGWPGTYTTIDGNPYFNLCERIGDEVFTNNYQHSCRAFFTRDYYNYKYGWTNKSGKPVYYKKKEAKYQDRLYFLTVKNCVSRIKIHEFLQPIHELESLLGIKGRTEIYNLGYKGTLLFSSPLWWTRSGFAISLLLLVIRNTWARLIGYNNANGPNLPIPVKEVCAYNLDKILTFFKEKDSIYWREYTKFCKKTKIIHCDHCIGIGSALSSEFINGVSGALRVYYIQQERQKAEARAIKKAKKVIEIFNKTIEQKVEK